MKKITPKIALTILVAILSINTSNMIASDELMKAMRDEMQRSMQELKLEDLQKPYYIEYILRTEQDFRVESTLGVAEQIKNGTDKAASLTVRVRVGNYKFDNSNFDNPVKNFFGSTTADDKERYVERSIPFNLDYISLRRELWLATDAAYKDAAEDYASKEAAQKNIIRKDTTWDFTRAEAAKYTDTTTFSVVNISDLEQLANSASAVFLKYPKIINSLSNVSFLTAYTYYLNSEGIEYIRSSSSSEINVAAIAQAEDGAAIYNYYNVTCLPPADFPSKDSVAIASKQVADKIIATMSAKTLDEAYSGPMIFADQAACELVAQAFAPNLIAQKTNLTAGSVEFSFGDGIYGNVKAFQNKIGGRVLPEFISLEDLPNLEKFQNIKLLGHYKFDDEGIKAQDILLVDKGFLKTLLSDRTPTKRINTSNGHKRSGAINYSNLKLTADKNKQLSETELKKQMLKICKNRDLPYGIIVRKITNKSVFVSNVYRLAYDLLRYAMLRTIQPLEVYKVYPDGREELLRDVELGGISPQSFKEIMRVGNTHNVHNFTAAASDWNSNDIDVSIIAPSLLFEDCELRVVDKDNKKLPILENPLSIK